MEVPTMTIIPMKATDDKEREVVMLLLNWNEKVR
jgi:hypothetical protein